MLVSPAFAKLNLTLEVLGRRSDGLHDLESALLTLDWHDLVGVEIRERRGDGSELACRLHVTGPEAGGIPIDGDNLAARAAVELARVAGRPLQVAVWLHKRLPSRAGLGGGSSDAATVLRCGTQLLELAGTPIASADLRAAAQRVGADVPALLVGGLQLVSGSGERGEGRRHADINCAVAVAGASDTATTYANLAVAEHGGTGRSRRVLSMLEGGDPLVDDDLGSALEGAATRAHPDLNAGLERLRDSTPGRRWHLTGSGGCAFAIASSVADAERLAGAARDAGLAARACRSTRAH